MKKILILNTGGTIGMTRTEKGYMPDREYFRKALINMDSLRAPGMPVWDLAETEELLDSSNMTVRDWNEIAKILADAYDSYDGFVVLHGTDTMAYTSSALSFMLEELDKPVILTGSQIPLCELRSDGRDNLISSMLIAAEGRVKEVCIYFGGKLLRGNRAMKYSADGLLAFTSPNYPPLAEAGISIQYNTKAMLDPIKKPFRLQLLEEVPIGVLKVFPGIQFGLFESIMTESLKGVVLESFGTGNIPSAREGLLPLLAKAHANGTVVTVCSQCPQGRVNLGAYAASRGLKEIGAADGADMTTEAALAKLYYLFSKGLPPANIKQLIPQNLRGELSE